MEIRFSASAARALLRSQKRDLIRRKIGELAADSLSVSANVKRLQGRAEYRLRVQDWRVIFPDRWRYAMDRRYRAARIGLQVMP